MVLPQQSSDSRDIALKTLIQEKWPVACSLRCRRRSCISVRSCLKPSRISSGGQGQVRDKKGTAYSYPWG